MRLLEYFHDYPSQPKPNPFHPKGTWTPPPHRDPALDTFLDTAEHDFLNIKPGPVRDNPNAHEQHPCKLLSRCSDIVIKSADKGSGTVVMNRDWYVNECLRQLNDTKFYKTIDNNITDDIQKHIQVYVQCMHRDKIIDDDTRRFLIQTDPKPGRFYILPKIHKQGNPGRTIVSSNSHPTERIYHSLLTIISNLSYRPHNHSSKTLHISSTNLNNLDNYPTMLFLSLLTSPHFTRTFPTTKILTLVDSSLTHATTPIQPSVLKLYATLYTLFLP